MSRPESANHDPPKAITLKVARVVLHATRNHGGGESGKGTEGTKTDDVLWN